MLRLRYGKPAPSATEDDVAVRNTLADVNQAIIQHKAAVADAVARTYARKHSEAMDEVMSELASANEEVRQLRQALIQAKIDYKKMGRKYRNATGETSRFWYVMGHMADMQNPGYDTSLILADEEVDAVYDDEPDLETDEMQEWKRYQPWSEWIQQVLGADGYSKFGTVFRFGWRKTLFQSEPDRVDWFMRVGPAPSSAQSQGTSYVWPMVGMAAVAGSAVYAASSLLKDDTDNGLDEFLYD